MDGYSYFAPERLISHPVVLYSGSSQTFRTPRASLGLNLGATETFLDRLNWFRFLATNMEVPRSCTKVVSQKIRSESCGLVAGE